MNGAITLLVGAATVSAWFWLLKDYAERNWNPPEPVRVEQRRGVRVIPAPYDQDRP